MSRIKNVNHIVFFGLQYFIKEYLIKLWNENFFNKPLDQVVNDYKRRMDSSLGTGAVGMEHIIALHKLGYLPIEIKAVPEGTKVPLRVACMTIQNTQPEFFWLTNYFESILSNTIWKPITSATIANEYKQRFNQHCEKTGYDPGFVNWQGHDFSFRGMSGLEDACMSGAGHLLSFTGTDTVHAIDFLEEFYRANSDKELVGGSVPATEHSVMCMGSEEEEIDTFKRLITEIYPNGLVSIVSDTWDFWKVVTEYLPALKEEILARNGRVVIRPDSGDPVRIICGYNDDEIHRFEDGWWHTQIEHVAVDGSFGFSNYHKIKPLSLAEIKGAYECLMDIFGYKENEKGYFEMNSHIGLIYGDSITLERQDEILSRLEAKKFSASNLVLGIGSFTYEYVTRDTFGMAMKATYGVVNGIPYNIFKKPKTDSGFKNSAKGLLKVDYNNKGVLTMYEEVSLEESQQGILQTVFKDGKLIIDQSLSEIRNRLKNI
jgi:nicotinamide phosphoribosyltransferase